MLDGHSLDEILTRIRSELTPLYEKIERLRELQIAKDPSSLDAETKRVAISPEAKRSFLFENRDYAGPRKDITRMLDGLTIDEILKEVESVLTPIYKKVEVLREEQIKRQEQAEECPSISAPKATNKVEIIMTPKYMQDDE
ncbi:MAG: hypothetical protein FWE79_02425 [Firmicutes bacterium]|nr:hypothetical protein [Bacillota bacterium]